ncbi:MAG: colanic acid biosynthesis glycosyl transferase WcaI [Flavobacteriaceae bacterium]
MKKNITIIGINYYPEDSAIGLYTTQKAEYLVSEGYNVSVITGFPYYPQWEINSEYQSKKKFYKENINGITVYRYKQYVPQKPTFFKRIVHLLDFSFGTFINIFKIKETDVVLCIVPFIGSVLLGKILSKRKSAKLWVHIQDFEFDAATDSNIIENKKGKTLFFKLLFWVEKKILNSADFVSSISASMVLKLENKIKPFKKRGLLPNWVDLDFINPDNYKEHKYLKSKKFKILYSGNIGEKQDWAFFLKFVIELEKEEGIEIIVVGDGSKREWLQKEIKNIKNISIHNPVAYKELPDLLCCADLHILFQKNNVIDTVMPSKILGMMASQKPSLITGNLKSEVLSIINKSKGGEYFNSENISATLNFVKTLKKNKTLRNEYGENARNYISLNFSKEKVLDQFNASFIDLVK